MFLQYTTFEAYLSFIDMQISFDDRRQQLSPCVPNVCSRIHQQNITYVFDNLDIQELL